MNWKFSDNSPIYAQIVEEISRRILSGAYKPGSSVPSVRQLAEEAGVNPNTMQKALAALESMQLIQTQRTSGRTVTTDERLIMNLKERLAHDYIEQFFTGMQSLGIGHDDAIKMISSPTVQGAAQSASMATADKSEFGGEIDG